MNLTRENPSSTKERDLIYRSSKKFKRAANGDPIQHDEGGMAMVRDQPNEGTHGE